MMLKYIKTSIFSFCSLAILAILFWPAPKVVNSPDMHFASYGNQQTKGNILGIQPWLHASHYQSPVILKNHIQGYLQAAQDKGWLNENTLVVLPEHIGTWLVASEQSGFIYSADSTDDALGFVVLRNLFSFINYFSQETAQDKVAASIFKLRSEYMAKHYQAIFESLAKDFNVTIAAGSIALQNPKVENGKLIIQEGPIFNTSAVFTPKGISKPLTKKIFPILDEQPFTAAAPVETLPTYTPTSQPFSVLICADSWFDAGYEQAHKQHQGTLLVPSFSTVSWDTPWHGYSGFDNPKDIELNDIEKITEGQAWIKYALASKAKKWGFHSAMNVFLRGDLWGFEDDGHGILWHEDLGVIEAESYDGPMLLNLWL